MTNATKMHNTIRKQLDHSDTQIRAASPKNLETLGKTEKDAGLAAASGSEQMDEAVPSKLGRIIDLLGRSNGATLAELCDATGWQAHSIRGALAGVLKKKGHVVTSDKTCGQRRYRIGATS